MVDEPDRRTSPFDWAVYADATFAGLSVLIPIPLVDLYFEWLFKRRMPKAIAKRRGVVLDWRVARELNRGRYGCWPGCFMWPVTLVLEFLKRLYRTIFYVLTIKSATDQLSYYWHRAFLIDYMLRRGDLTVSWERVMAASAAMDALLGTVNTSPLLQLAQQVVDSGTHFFRTIWRWVRRRQEDEMVAGTKAKMAVAWRDFDGYFEELASRYDVLYESHLAQLTKKEEDG
jgi:hypothetical protein